MGRKISTYMLPHRRRIEVIALLVLAFGTHGLLSDSAYSQSIASGGWRNLRLSDGKLLVRVKVTKVEDDGLRVMSESGLMKVKFAELDPTIQKEFGYDAANPPIAKPQSTNEETSSSPSAEPPSLDDIANAPTIEDAMKVAGRFVVGVWTFTGQQTIMPGAADIFWFRVVFRENGTFSLYTALPAADNWGTPSETGTFVPKSAKYADTGTRWFGVTTTGTPKKPTLPAVTTRFIIKPDGSLMMMWGGGPPGFRLERGDRNPFSK